MKYLRFSLRDMLWLTAMLVIALSCHTIGYRHGEEAVKAKMRLIEPYILVIPSTGGPYDVTFAVDPDDYVLIRHLAIKPSPYVDAPAYGFME